MKKRRGQEVNEYGIDVKKYSNHRAAFPWAILLKILVGLGLIAFIYYLSHQFIEQEMPKKENQFEIKLENV